MFTKVTSIRRCLNIYHVMCIYVGTKINSFSACQKDSHAAYVERGERTYRRESEDSILCAWKREEDLRGPDGRMWAYAGIYIGRRDERRGRNSSNLRSGNFIPKAHSNYMEFGVLCIWYIISLTSSYSISNMMTSYQKQIQIGRECDQQKYYCSSSLLIQNSEYNFGKITVHINHFIVDNFCVRFSRPINLRVKPHHLLPWDPIKLK